MTESKYKKHVFVCTNERPSESPKGDCARCGGNEIRLEFVKSINRNGLKGIVRVNKSGCLDACEMGPVLVIYPRGIWYIKVGIEDVEEIVNTSIINDNTVERLVARNESWSKLNELRKNKRN